MAYFAGVPDNDPNQYQLDKICAAMLMGHEKRAEHFLSFLFHVLENGGNLPECRIQVSEYIIPEYNALPKHLFSE